MIKQKNLKNKLKEKLALLSQFKKMMSILNKIKKKNNNNNNNCNNNNNNNKKKVILIREH